MKTRVWLAAAALLTLSPVALAAPLKVAVSIVPEQWLIEQLGGDDVDIMTLVKPGLEPEDYTPSPRQLAALSDTALYFSIGVPFEAAWLERIQARAPQMQLVDLHENLPLRQIEAHHHGHDEEESGHHDDHAGMPDPHVWLDPQLMITMAHRAANALAEELPTKAQDIHRREAALVQALEDKTQDIAQQLEPYAGRSFMVYHPAWGYYADRFHLIQRPIELNGREPTPRSLSALITQARRDDIHVIFVQEQFSQTTAQRLAHSLDAEVATLDPLAEDYLDNLQRITDALVEGFHKSQRETS